MSRSASRDREAARAIDAIEASLAETLLDRVAILDADGVITATTDAWEAFIAGEGEPILQGATVGISLPDHLHKLATSGNLLARDALVRLLSVVQGVNQLAEFEYQPARLSHVWRYRLSISKLSDQEGGALVAHSSLVNGSPGRGRDGPLLLHALCDQLGTDYAGVWEFTECEPPALRVLVEWESDSSVPVGGIPASGPWVEVAHKGYRLIPHGVRSLSVGNTWLDVRNAQSFAGITIGPNEREPIRILVVAGCEELTDTLSTEALLRTVGQQISPWLDVQQQESRSPPEALDLVLATSEMCSEGILIFDANGGLLGLNSAARALLAHEIETHSGVDLSALAGDKWHRDTMWNELRTSGVWKAEKELHIGEDRRTVRAPVEVRRITLFGREWIEAVIHYGADGYDREKATRPVADSQSEVLSQYPDSVFRIRSDGVCSGYWPGKVEQLFWKKSPVGRSLDEMLPAWIAVDLHSMILEALTSHQTQVHEFMFEIGGHIYPRDLRAVPISEGEVLLVCRDPSTEHAADLERERQQKVQEIEGKAEHLMIRHNPYGLTFRELSVLHLVAEGLGDKEIAKRIGVSIFTVNKHVAKILEKMGAASRTEAAVRAARENLVL